MSKSAEKAKKLQTRIDSADGERLRLYAKRTASWLHSMAPWLLYPLAMALIIATTAFTGAIVLYNMLGLLFNRFSMGEHTGVRLEEPFVLGIASISKMGLLGAFVQMGLIIYIGVASFVGLYTLPVLERLRPTPGATPFFMIMLNCMVLLILSSALPLFTRTVGITNFDLFGNFGQIVWTRNYHLVLVYNGAFLVALAFCLCHSIVVRLSVEAFNRLRLAFLWAKSALEAFHERFLHMKETVIRRFYSPVADTDDTDGGEEEDSTSESKVVTSNGNGHTLQLKAKSVVMNSSKALLHTTVAFLWSALHFREVNGAEVVGSPIKEVKSK